MAKPRTHRDTNNDRRVVLELPPDILQLPAVQLSITEGVPIPQWIQTSGYARWTVEKKDTTPYTLLVIHGGFAIFRGGLALIKLPTRGKHRMAFHGPCDVLKIVGPTGYSYENYRLCQNCFRNTPNADAHPVRDNKWNVNFACPHCGDTWRVPHTDWTFHQTPPHQCPECDLSLTAGSPKHHHHQASPR